MKTIREILRLSELGLSQRAICRSLRVGRTTVQDYQKRALAAGLNFEAAEHLDDASLYKAIGKLRVAQKRYADLDWPKIHTELKGAHVTLELLWNEYQQSNPGGQCYSNFTNGYRRWLKSQKVWHRQIHKAGEKVFVDYCGPTIPIYQLGSTEVSHRAQVFVAVLGASSLMYAEASMSQKVEDWLGAHIRAFEFFGGVPRVVVSDNLKSGVTKACRYEPEINLSYQELAEYYGTAIIPTRVRRPKDKGKVEKGVQIVERWIIAALRHYKFYSLSELNIKISELLDKINSRPLRQAKLSRYALFEQLERKELRPLPLVRFEIGVRKIARVNIDYHIELDKNYYSVPCQLIYKEVETRMTDNTVEVFHNFKRVALHLRRFTTHAYVTEPAHLPAAQRHMRDWTPSKFINWGNAVGPETLIMVKAILNSKVYPEQTYRSCLGLLTLAKKFSNQRLEAACKKANAIGVRSMRSVKNMLLSGQDQVPSDSEPIPDLTIQHPNIRGSGYFH